MRTTARAVPVPHPTARHLHLPLLLVLALVLWSVAPVALAEPSEEPAAERGYQAVGPEVTGGASLAQAPLIAPGIHLDSFAQGETEDRDGTGTVRYYRIAVSGGQRVHAAATISAPLFEDGLPEERQGLGLEAGFVDASGDSCTEKYEPNMGEFSTGDGPITATAMSSQSGWDGCAGEEMFLRVTRSGTRAADQALPVEIQVAIEPAGIGGGSPAVTEEIEDDGASPVPPASDEVLTPGRSFATATEVEPGSHVLSLTPGEVAMLRIEVGEGQRLRWRTEVTSQPEKAGYLVLAVRNAVRNTVTVRGGDQPLFGGTQVEGGGMAAPVDRGNRSSSISAVATAWLPGTHTVILQRTQLKEGADPASAEPITVVLTLELDGEVSPDAPEGTVLELGEPFLARGPLAALGLDTSGMRLLQLGGAGVLTMLGLLLGLASVLVLRRRRV